MRLVIDGACLVRGFALLHHSCGAICGFGLAFPKGNEVLQEVGGVYGFEVLELDSGVGSVVAGVQAI